MADIGTMLKGEIRRLARKAVNAETESTRQAVAQYRRDIARLKKQVQILEKTVVSLKAQGVERTERAEEVEDSLDNTRFSARSVRAQRKRLGLSAADYARLVGVSSLTIYNWEHGKSRPREAQMTALVAVRGIGKRAAMAKLASLDAVESKKAGA